MLLYEAGETRRDQSSKAQESAAGQKKRLLNRAENLPTPNKKRIFSTPCLSLFCDNLANLGASRAEDT